MLIDKLCLLGAGLILLLMGPVSEASAAAFLTALTIGCLTSYFKRPLLSSFSAAAFMALSVPFPLFIPFVPLQIYETVYYRLKLPALFGAAVCVRFISSASAGESLFAAGFIIITGLLALRTANYDKLSSEFIRQRDDSRELNLLLREKNKSLREKQDYEIRLATLHERNRIAREIHDHVGHMLSRSILQTGALAALNKDKSIDENLSALQDTLNQAMENIRLSVHDLHEDAVDLQNAIGTLIQSTPSIHIRLDYDMSPCLPREIKYSLIAIIKEAISNTARHSNADSMTIILREHPAFYQAYIIDNGTAAPPSLDSGLGLSNMQERIRAHNGTITFTFEHGFKIFISIPKLPEKEAQR